MTVPAMAVETEVTIGTGGGGDDGDSENAPFIVAKFETPDEVNGEDDGVNVLPEFPIPDEESMLFDDPLADGWKMVKYYFIMSDPQGDAEITGADIIVSYPETGLEKYNLHVTRVRNFDGPYEDVFGCYTWSVSSNIPNEVYPTGEAAVVPALNVRELRYQPMQSWTVDADGDGDLDGVVDGDAECDTADPSPIDQIVPNWLTSYGTRVTYGENPYIEGVDYNATTATALLVERENDDTGKAIMLEVTAYIWCHQDPVCYDVDVSAIATDGESEPLNNQLCFVPQASLYIDFDEIDWGTVTPPQAPISFKMVNKYGDRILGTENLPTIWNNGNFAGMVSVDATKMLLDGNSANDMDGKRIDSFDVSLDYIDSANQTVQEGKIVFSSADAPMLITETSPVAGRPILLPPCTPTQIDFSLKILAGLVSGEYEGTITLTIANYSPIPSGILPYDLGYLVGPGG